MECQDVTAHIAEYLAGSMSVEELEALLTHAETCAACRETLTAAEEMAPDLTEMRRRFDAELAGYQDGLGGRPRRLPRCATCSFPGQSCSWICRRRFID